MISTLEFLSDLKNNNNREWFAENKSRYEVAKVNHHAWVNDWLDEIRKFDSSIGDFTAKDVTFRIHRDTRFSKDKTPYKIGLGAFVSMAGSKSDLHTRAGYYVHIEPGNSFLAGGAYMPEGDWLKQIRQEIDYNGAELAKIINNIEFKALFPNIEGEKLSRPPKGYAADNEFIDLLKHKSFIVTHLYNDKNVLSPDFMNIVVKQCTILKPFIDYFNKI